MLCPRRRRLQRAWYWHLFHGLWAGATGRTANSPFLAVATVKKPTHSIFAKLAVSNRTQAVLAARGCGLLTEVPGSSAE